MRYLSTHKYAKDSPVDYSAIIHVVNHSHIDTSYTYQQISFSAQQVDADSFHFWCWKDARTTATHNIVPDLNRSVCITAASITTEGFQRSHRYNFNIIENCILIVNLGSNRSSFEFIWVKMLLEAHVPLYRIAFQCLTKNNLLKLPILLEQQLLFSQDFGQCFWDEFNISLYTLDKGQIWANNRTIRWTMCYATKGNILISTRFRFQTSFDELFLLLTIFDQWKIFTVISR